MKVLSLVQNILVNEIPVIELRNIITNTYKTH